MSSAIILVLLIPSVNIYRLIISGHTPYVHMIPSRNANDQNQSIPQSSLRCNTMPWVIQSPPFVQSLTFQVPRHSLPERSIPWKYFLASEDLKTKAYPYLKTIILIIACSWKSMDTIGYQCPTMALLLNALPSYFCSSYFIFFVACIIEI